MSDVLTQEQRRRCMSAIRGCNTKPELMVRSLLHRLGYRFRLHRKDLPGKPDIVLPRYGTVIFVHGCFWHMHSCKFGQVTPKTNAQFWQRKRLSNVDRDARVVASLTALGIRPVIIWECETRDPVKLEKKLIIALKAKKH